MAERLKRRRWGWVLWLVALVGAGFGVRRLLANRATKVLEVRTHRVTRGRVRELVSSVSSGRVAARREATLRAELAGTIVRLHHRRGERVALGEPLVSYDARELRDRVAVAEAAVRLSRAQIEQARASSQVAARNAQRAARLRDQQVAPPSEAETLQGQADVAARAEGVAGVGLTQAQANVLLARDTLARAVLRAPFAGTVMVTSVEEGEVSAPGAPLLQLADTTELHVDADLDEADLGRMREGLDVEVTLDAFPDERFRGRVSEIAPSVTRDLRGNRSIAIKVTLEPDPRLRVGMSADTDVIVATRDDVLSVPPNAVLGRGTNRSVYVFDHGVARRRPIDAGIATWEAVEVRSGLREGDEVLTTLSSPELADGVAVRVTRENADPARPSAGASRDAGSR